MVLLASGIYPFNSPLSFDQNENFSLEKINNLNNLETKKENYFLKHFGETYFTDENAIKIGAIREKIENISENEDSNSLIRKISCNVLYIDPPYNSRQYSDAYHLLENLSEWKKPKVERIAKKWIIHI